MLFYKNDDGSTNIDAVVNAIKGIQTNDPVTVTWANFYNGKFFEAQDNGLLPHFMWQTSPNDPGNDYPRGTGTNNPALEKLNQLLNPGGPITLPDYDLDSAISGG